MTELPSLKHIKNLRIVLALMTKSLAAYSFGHAKEIKQMHNDETSRRHVPLINTVVTILDQNDKLKTLCLSGSIIADDKSSEAQTGVKIQADGKLLLDHDFMMNIFSDLQIPELEAYLKYEFEEKMGNGTGSKKCSDRVLANREAMTELFWPTK